MNFFSKDTRNALQAKEYAQQIAFAPMVFQATKVLRNSGILAAIKATRSNGITLDALVQKTGLPLYGTRVLVEAGLGIGLILLNDDKYTLTNAGFFILNDEMTRVNFDFSNDVCYNGMFSLDESIARQKPEGLKVFGEWPTIYEGLSSLPENIRKSWLDFDHYYSDNAFETVLPHVFKEKPSKILDIGGNTGKWSIACANYDADVSMTIADLPGQTAMAQKNVEAKGLSGRINFTDTDMLDANRMLPGGFDAVWMSQFLDCFSEAQIVAILNKCAGAVNGDGYVYILETFWDKQRFEISAFCLQMTSLYFTAMANGNSQMYDSKVFFKLIEQAGFTIVEQVDNIGVSHTLLKCKKIK